MNVPFVHSDRFVRHRPAASLARRLAVLLAGCVPLVLAAQQVTSKNGGGTTLPSGTILQVELLQHAPMKSGEPLRAQLIYPVYSNDRLVLAAGTIVSGQVTSLEADRPARMHARLYGDFTPFHTPHVDFDKLQIAGQDIAFSATAMGGVPVIRLARPNSSQHHGFIASQWHQSWAALHDSVRFVTAPGRGDRLLQFVYHQLPYHPERIPIHSEWTLQLTHPLNLPAEAIQSPEISADHAKKHLVEALLTSELTSSTAHTGDAVTAVVVEPFADANNHMTFPQGATLAGKVTEARAARVFGRSGRLRFAFYQVRLPASKGQQVEGSLAGATASQTQDLSMDAEGGVTPRSRSNPIVPLGLALLATRALDFDDPDLVMQSSVASNGFGLVGRVVGTAAGSRELAAGIGFYAVALSTWANYIRPGQNVVFPKYTRIEIELNPVRDNIIKPQSAH